MYIIKYEHNSIYAGTWNDIEGAYLYASNSLNKQKPKVFKTLKGVQNHINKLLNKIPYPNESNLTSYLYWNGSNRRTECKRK